jgi:hypothetical protein
VVAEERMIAVALTNVLAKIVIVTMKKNITTIE